MAVATPIATTVATDTVLRRLHALGQSIWLDFISRGVIRSGELKALADEGLLGVTSNPTIFEKAITAGGDYDDQLTPLARAGKSPADIFEALAIKDIQDAADVLRPAYESLEGADGFVSLEVSPKLANDTQASIDEAARLWAAVNRPNVFIKIPGTAAGVPAIRESISRGINVNVTLLFDVDRYEEVANAFVEGLEQRVSAGQPIARVASVASFFVSRVDTAVDALLQGRSEHQALLGTAAVDNAKVAYERFERIFAGPRWAALSAKGAHVQRVLWASTSTKNPAYKDTKYVDPLIGPHTINTVPPQTLDAIRERANVRVSIRDGLAEAHAQLEALAQAGVDLRAVAYKLEVDGVAAFAMSYDDLLASIEQKAQQIRHG